MKWKPPETAPKNGNTILVNLGYPWATIAAWNEPSKAWVYTVLGADLYHGEWNDTYFENEHARPEKLIGWMPLPEIKKG